MTEFVPIEPAGKSERELLEAALKQIEQTHRCTHETQQSLRQFQNESRQHRHNTANALASLQGGVRALENTVGGLAADVGGLKGGASRLAQEMGEIKAKAEATAKTVGALPWEKGETRKAPAPARGQSWRNFGIAMAVLLGLAGLVNNAGVYALLKGQLVAADKTLTGLANK